MIIFKCSRIRKVILSSICLFLLFASNSFANKSSNIEEEMKHYYKQDRLLGNVIKSALETYHYRRAELDKDLAPKAFDEYIKKIDYGRQFLLYSDFKKLSHHRSQIVSQVLNGPLMLVYESKNILRQRIIQADKMREEIFKKPFDFKHNEFLELDPEKIKFAKSEKELKDRWRKTFKRQVALQYLGYLEGDLAPNGKDKKDKKDKKGKKKIPEKKMSKKEMLQKARKDVNERYTEFFKRLLKDDRNDYIDKFFNAVTIVFDPHTNYLPAREKENFDISISGSLEGIGAELTEDGVHIKVNRVIIGGAAWRAKELSVDDVILAVSQSKDEDPINLVGMRVGDAVRYIRGPKGTKVYLTVKSSDGTRKVISIVRDLVQVNLGLAQGSVIEQKKLGVRVGYIRLPKFYRDLGKNSRSCTEDVRREIIRLKSQNIQALILDLRSNGGGALEDARQMSGLFIPQGPIVQVKNHNSKVEVLSDNDPNVLYEDPVIVLVNRFSASASEILAGALQDYKRAIIVGGEYTHGKGTVQALINLSQGPILSIFGGDIGSLKITIQKFYRINGHSTQFKGITPDIILPDPFAYIESRERDLEHSIPWDRISPKKFTPWPKKYNLVDLKKRSEKRVANSAYFKTINQTVKLLTESRNDTYVPLKLSTIQKRNKKDKQLAKSLKVEEDFLNKDISVIAYEGVHNPYLRSQDKKRWKEDWKEYRKEWVKGLQKDLILDETLHIVADFLRGSKDKKLSSLSQ